MPPDYFALTEPSRCFSTMAWSAIGVFASRVDRTVHTGRRGAPRPIHLGTAIPAGDTLAEPREVVWRLVIRGVLIDGAYRVHDHRFEELGDAAEWTRRPGVSVAIETTRQGWRWSRR